MITRNIVRLPALLLAGWIGAAGGALAASPWDQPTPLLAGLVDQSAGSGLARAAPEGGRAGIARHDQSAGSGLARTAPEGGRAGIARHEMTVYHSPTCNCCNKWLDHVKQHGFQVTDVIAEDMNAVKKRLGVPANLASCHTAVVGGYVVEGHVPAGDIKKLLTEKPPIAGIAAPGMPVGSPGMEMDGRQDSFSVKSFDKEGKTATFSEHGSQ